jgi:hypothetical protein
MSWGGSGGGSGAFDLVPQGEEGVLRCDQGSACRGGVRAARTPPRTHAWRGAPSLLELDSRPQGSDGVRLALAEALKRFSAPRSQCHLDKESRAEAPIGTRATTHQLRVATPVPDRQLYRCECIRKRRRSLHRLENRVELDPELSSGSPFDVEGIELGITREEIVSFVREGRRGDEPPRLTKGDVGSSRD